MIFHLDRLPAFDIRSKRPDASFAKEAVISLELAVRIEKRRFTRPSHPQGFKVYNFPFVFPVLELAGGYCGGIYIRMGLIFAGGPVVDYC